MPARIARHLYRLHFRVARARRHNRVDLARIHGLQLLVLPGVFHPEFFFGTGFFLQCLDDVPIRKGARVLDMGTGSGALGLALARRGARVTAVDINPEAVRCARANALLHGVESRMDVLEGDLFAPIADQRFEMIVFNPPFYGRRVRGTADFAWAAGPNSETVYRFFREIPDHLEAHGQALLLGSTEAPFTRFLPQLLGYSTRQIAHRELVSERLMLFAVRRLE
jgi:release factor glutamine methyltransferase